jgi:SAM-dependent methyltransferase
MARGEYVISNDLKCIKCGHPRPESAGPHLRCGGCGQVYRVQAGVANFLYEPEDYVLSELRATMRENDFPSDDIDEFVVREVEHLETIDERIQSSREQRDKLNYCESTKVNFDAAFQTLSLTGKEKVLEIGAGSHSYFLRSFFEKGCDCTGVDICFRVEKGGVAPFYYRRILADMNKTPFVDGAFDVVMASATTHHSPYIGRVLGEMSRLVRPGGLMVIINEPVKGLLKSLSRPSNPCERDEMINENEYSLFAYTSRLKKEGFAVRLLLPEYVNQKLQAGTTSGFRFGGLGAALSFLWRRPLLKRTLKGTLLYLGLVFLGVPLVLVARKGGA